MSCAFQTQPNWGKAGSPPPSIKNQLRTGTQINSLFKLYQHVYNVHIFNTRTGQFVSLIEYLGDGFPWEGILSFVLPISLFCLCCDVAILWGVSRSARRDFLVAELEKVGFEFLSGAPVATYYAFCLYRNVRKLRQFEDRPMDACRFLIEQIGVAADC